MGCYVPDVQFPDGSFVLRAIPAEAATNFNAFTTVQQDAVRKVLANYSSVANLTFTEVTETSTQHADAPLRRVGFAEYGLGLLSEHGEPGRRCLVQQFEHYYDKPVSGNYAYLTMLHETGHALGLKHPHEVKGSFGAMPLDHDSLEYTVMSYRSYVGGSDDAATRNGSTSYPQTLMMYDIAAIQDDVRRQLHHQRRRHGL